MGLATDLSRDRSRYFAPVLRSK